VRGRAREGGVVGGGWLRGEDKLGMVYKRAGPTPRER
jgi:hypothetical protein